MDLNEGVTREQKKELLQREFLSVGLGPNDPITFERLNDILKQKGVNRHNGGSTLQWPGRVQHFWKDAKEPGRHDHYW